MSPPPGPDPETESESAPRPGEAGKKATKYDAWAYVVIGLIGIPLFALGVGALVLPPGISFALVRRGLGEGKLHWTILGALTGLLWIALLAFTARKIFGSQRSRRPPDSGNSGDRLPGPKDAKS